ncbi:RteC domain-containing protein [Spirosoma spitsbergense]|uniref:RteC domain-containing protein n=1 Tax=Spirosoma spitsbergense TaxID=431554 RepID=UPI00036D0C56|nr:RteC domain-containing protein [Spirosoma spitsbergense]
MPTPNSWVTSFSNLNTRIELTLMFTDLSTHSIDTEINKQVIDFVKTNELGEVLEEFFVSRNETALQTIYAKTLIEVLLDQWLRVNKYVFEKLSHLQDRKTHLQDLKAALKRAKVTDINSLVTDDAGNPIPVFEFKYINENIITLNLWGQWLESLNRRVIHLIRQFAPEIYKRHSNEFRKYISVKEFIGVTVDNQEPTPIIPEVKLQWKGDKTDLAEVIWALAKSEQIVNVDSNKPVIIAELTQKFETLFGIEKLDVDGLVSKRILNTYKHADGKTFLDSLQKLMQARVARSQKK